MTVQILTNIHTLICVQVSALKNILTNDIAIFYLQSICTYYTISK